MIKIFGKIYETPRYQQAFGKDYYFSGNVSKSLPIPELFKKYLNYFSEKYNCNFNMLLINWYENGEHYIGLHSDDEKQIVPKTPVISISFGATRKLTIKKQNNKRNNIL